MNKLNKKLKKQHIFKKSIKKMFRRLFILKCCFSEAKPKCDILLSFRRKLSALEYLASSMKVAPLQKRLLPPEESSKNRVVKTFFSGPDDVFLYDHSDKVINPADKTQNNPRSCWSQITLPLSTNVDLRNRFVRFYTNRVRIGKLLEVLDYAAANTSYLFCHSEPFSRTSTNVTLCMDNMHFFKPIQADKDLSICSYPTFNGKSTVEIRVDIYQESDEKMGTDLVGSTHFLMAARELTTHKAFKVPQLTFEGEEDIENCMLRYELGKKFQEQRKINSNLSLYKTPPSAEESVELHSLFMRNTHLNEGVDYISLEKTTMHKNLLIHLQDRNLHGKAFGGMLMREAFETGWLTAFSFCKGKFPEIHHIDDVMFITPVDIGSIIKFEAKVSFTQGHLLHVAVEVIKNNPEGEKIKASELHLTLVCPELNLLSVYPEKYSEGILYLEAKRRMKYLLDNVKV